MPTLRRLTDADLSYVPAPDEFAALAAATLGNAGTSTDGHDAEMQALAVTLAADTSTPGLLDGDLASAAFSPGEFRGGTLGPVASEYDALHSGGDSALGDFGAATGVTVAAPPEPAPAPSPPPAPAPAPAPPPPSPAPDPGDVPADFCDTHPRARGCDTDGTHDFPVGSI